MGFGYLAGIQRVGPVRAQRAQIIFNQVRLLVRSVGLNDFAGKIDDRKVVRSGKI